MLPHAEVALVLKLMSGMPTSLMKLVSILPAPLIRIFEPLPEGGRIGRAHRNRLGIGVGIESLEIVFGLLR